MKVYVIYPEIEYLGRMTRNLQLINKKMDVVQLLDIKQLDNINFRVDDIIVTNHDLLVEEKIKNHSSKIIITNDSPKEGELLKDFKFTELLDLFLGFIFEEKQDYYPITLDSLKFRAYPNEFYIKLRENKYLKISNAKKIIDQEFIFHYQDKQIEELWVKEDQLRLFYIANIIENSKKDEQTDASKNINTVEALHKYIKDFGIDEKIIQQTKNLQSSVEAQFNNDRFMKSLFFKLKNMEGTFLYNHSYFTAVLALQIGQKFKWMNAENREKIYLGSMLHDLGFTNEDNAPKEFQITEHINELPEGIRDDILDHPIRFSEKLRTETDVHDDIINIMANHHSVVPDEAYPHHIKQANINMIFALFIVCHEFSIQMFKTAFNEKQIKSTIVKLKSRYYHQNFQKIIPEIEKFFENYL